MADPWNGMELLQSVQMKNREQEREVCMKMNRLSTIREQIITITIISPYKRSEEDFHLKHEKKEPRNR